MDLRVERQQLEAALAGHDDAGLRVRLGGVLQLCGEHALALAQLEPAVEAARAAGMARVEVEGLIALGVSRQLLGLPDAGITYRDAIALAGSLLGESDPLTARACWELGSMVRDADLVERAARIWVACAQPAWSMRARAFVAAMRRQPARELYAQALAALDLAVGETSPLVIEVLLEAAEAFDPAPARAMRERAVRIARATTGPGSQRTVDTLWALATATTDASVFDTDTPEAVMLYTKAAFLDREGPTDAGLRVREQSLVLREQALGVESTALVPLVSEIKLGWDELELPEESEAFLRRCRDRVPAASWVYRNLTYSIGYLLSAQRRDDDHAALWKDFLAQRAAACAPDSAAMLEALEIVATQLPHYSSDAASVADEPPRISTPPAMPGVERLVLDLRERFDPAILRAVLDHASELVLQVAYLEGEYPQHATNARAVLAVLAEQPRPLHALALLQRTIETDPTEDLEWIDGCDHRELGLQLPWLRRLHLGGYDLVHALAHPTLEHLVLDDRPICAGGAWELPALRTLEWAFRGSTTDQLADTELATIDPVWTQPLPALRELVLRGSFYDCDEPLARPEIHARLARLEQLTLPASMLGDDPVDALLAATAALRHLARLEVTDLPADPRLARLRREVPGLVGA